MVSLCISLGSFSSQYYNGLAYGKVKRAESEHPCVNFDHLPTGPIGTKFE